MQRSLCRCQAMLARSSIDAVGKCQRVTNSAIVGAYRGLATSSRVRWPQEGKQQPLASTSTSKPTSSSSSSEQRSIDGANLYTERARTGGPFSWKAAAVFLATGGGLYLYFQNEKKKIQERKKQETAAQKVGRPKIGGAFKLTDQHGKDFTDQDLLGKFSLVYFGFTNCPDICPEELDKMSSVVDKILAFHGKDSLLPVFITCDPARDDVNAIRTYCKDFHPSLVGLTGSYDDIKKTCKTYRVYFSTPPDAKPTDDYLVDHSIFFYLMDPTGQFVDAFGRSTSMDEVTGKVDNYMKDWKAGRRFSEE